MSSLNESVTGAANDLADILSEAEADLQSLSEHLTSTELDKYKEALLNTENYYKLKKALAKRYDLEAAEEELETLRNSSDASAEMIAAKEKEVQDLRRTITLNACRGTLALERNAYAGATASRKAELKKELQENIEKRKKQLIEERDMEIAIAEAEGKETSSIKARYAEELTKLNDKQSEARRAQYALEQQAVTEGNQRLSESLNNLKEHPSLKTAGEAFVQLHLAGGEALQEMLKEQKRIAQETSQAARESRENYQKVMDDPNSTQKQKDDAKKEYLKDVKKANDANMQALVGELANQVKEAFNAQFQQVESMMQTYQSHIEARLQGSGKSYGGLLGLAGIQDTITTVLSINPFVKSKEVLEAVRKASDQGIAYNIEQRAFLATVADKIANTFDAFDSNLTRLIRLQQADTTAARLGMEASLTKFFNRMFEDTSYLNSMYDAVSSAIIDANASMSRDQSAEFEYIVQKWLGSLSSLGMSDEAVGELAKGINYLATGDVSSLSSNTELQTLIAMSASEAGLEYSELLLKGLDAQSTNKLMASMVTYLKRIAETSENQVVRSAYGDVFNLSMSDMRAISNLRTDEIEAISSSMMDYSQMKTELDSQFLQIALRTHISEMMGNLYDNAVFGVASDMVGNPATYAMYKMLDFMQKQHIDMEIPFVNVSGFGLGVGASVQDLMRLGVGIASATSLLTNILGGLATDGGMDLDSWGGGEYTRRGTSEAFSTGAISEGLSSSIYVEANQLTNSNSDGSSNANYVSSGNSDDMKNSTLNSAADDAEETSEITNKNLDVGYTIDDLYKVTVEGEEGSGKQRTVDTQLKEVFNDKISNFLSTQDYRMVYSGGPMDGGLRVHDNYLAQIFSDSMVLSSGGTALKVVLDGLNYAQGMLQVSDDSLTGAYDSADHFLAVKDLNQDYESDKSLRVYNTNETLYTELSPFLRGDNSFGVKLTVSSDDTPLPVSNAVLTASDGGGHIKVKDVGINYEVDKGAVKVKVIQEDSSPIVVKYYDVSAIVKAFNAEKYTVKIDSESITSLGNAIVGQSNDNKKAKTISDLYSLFSDTKGADKAHVRIQNEDNKRLQVDTEIIGAGTGAGYDTQFDLSKNITW